MAVRVIYVVEQKLEENELLWGPFSDANQAAEWALANMVGGMLKWTLKPVRAVDKISEI